MFPNAALSPGFCYNTYYPTLCSGLWWIIVLSVIIFILVKFLAPKNKPL